MLNYFKMVTTCFWEVFAPVILHRYAPVPLNSSLGMDAAWFATFTFCLNTRAPFIENSCTHSVLSEDNGIATMFFPKVIIVLGGAPFMATWTPTEAFVVKDPVMVYSNAVL